MSPASKRKSFPSTSISLSLSSGFFSTTAAMNAPIPMASTHKGMTLRAAITPLKKRSANLSSRSSAISLTILHLIPGVDGGYSVEYVPVSNPEEARVFHYLLQFLLRGELPYGLREIDVGVPVTRHHLAYRGDDIEGEIGRA